MLNFNNTCMRIECAKQISKNDKDEKRKGGKNKQSKLKTKKERKKERKKKVINLFVILKITLMDEQEEALK